MRGTRVDILQQLEDWLENEQGQYVLWLNGLAGTGKSTIAQTFAEITFAEGRLGASFFCSRDFEDRSDFKAILPTLAFQLAYRYPLFREQLLQVLRANPGTGHQTTVSQMETLIVGPFQATQIPTLIIIDALDECQDQEPASALLSVLSCYVDKIPFVKFFITGRPEPWIRSGFRMASLQPHTNILRLHDVKRDAVDSDIKLFLKTQLTDIAKNRSVCDFAEDWPSSQDIDVICKKAAGFFISLPQATSHEGQSGIDLLYTQVLGQAFHGKDQAFYLHFKLVVGTVLLIFNPLSVKGLSALLKNSTTQSRIYNTLCALHSLLLIPDSIENPVRIFHKSFPDFLTDPHRCTDTRFFIYPPIFHREILTLCLNVMKGELRRNICNLDNHIPLIEVKDLPARRADCIGDALWYACCFWTNHLVKVPSSSPSIDEVQKEVNEFFTTCFLFWIEVLSLMGNLGIGVHALNDVQNWYILVSHMWRANLRILCLWFFRQAFPASGQMTASIFSWNTST